jgi:beta-glucosidase
MTPRLLRALAAVAAAASALPSFGAGQAAPYQDPTAPVETRVADLLPRLTQEEKLQLLGGFQEFYIRPLARLGLPQVRMADGPQGVRNYGPSTAYPATVSLGASWDPDLAREFGASLANDARARGVSIMLGPGVNIMRVPQNGRNFEYLSEDPYLAGAVAAQIVAGMQGRGVVATVKHFAANNQETDRGTIDTNVSERALREIYLPAFEAAVKKGHAWAVMSAYNRLNGTYCSANDWLNNQVLKDDWGFPGVLMSDWGAAHGTLGAANGGLDLEMPSGVYMNPSTLGPAILAGKVAQATVDDKVRRILRLEIANGFLDRSLAETGPKDDPASDATALKIAREAVVLLKNDRAALPFTGKKFRRIIVLGPNGLTSPAGGGSGHVGPFHFVSLVEGLRKAMGSKVKVESIEGPGAGLLDALVKSARYEGPLRLEFVRGDGGDRRVLASASDASVDHDWSSSEPAPGVATRDLHAHWTGSLRAPATGNYVLLMRGHGSLYAALDGKPLITEWFNTGDTRFAEVALEAGSVHALDIDFKYDNQGPPAVRFAWGETPPLLSDAEAAQVKAADAVVVAAGFNAMTEGEGTDRAYDLPDRQVELIQRAAALNPRTVVVVYSGGVVGTAGWIGRVPALVQAWYPGQEGGRALGEILAGTVNPSGKLPITYEARREDSPSFGNFPGTNGSVDYAEGIFVGYRGFDHRGIAPLFPFGYGLSYTSFHYANLAVAPDAAGTWKVSFDVTNIGTLRGDEVAQVYVSPPVTSRVPRPVRELKGFGRVSLLPDQTAGVSVVLDRRSFSYFDEKKGDWVVEPGSYTIEVGSSSRTILLSAPAPVN